MNNLTKQKFKQHKSHSCKAKSRHHKSMYLNARKTRHWARSCFSCCSLKGMPENTGVWETEDFPVSLEAMVLSIVVPGTLFWRPTCFFQKNKNKKGIVLVKREKQMKMKPKRQSAINLQTKVRKPKFRKKASEVYDPNLFENNNIKASNQSN